MPPPRSARPHVAGGADELRGHVQRFVRSFGLLAGDRTPCGKPLATSHAHALMVLLESAGEDRRPTQQELGRALGIDKSNVARLCRKMEGAGHLRQERSELDGRARLLRLTDAGRRVAAGVERSSRERFRRIMLALSAETRANVLSALDRLNDAVAASLEPSPGGRKPDGRRRC